MARPPSRILADAVRRAAEDAQAPQRMAVARQPPVAAAPAVEVQAPARRARRKGRNAAVRASGGPPEARTTISVQVGGKVLQRGPNGGRLVVQSPAPPRFAEEAAPPVEANVGRIMQRMRMLEAQMLVLRAAVPARPVASGGAGQPTTVLVQNVHLKCTQEVLRAHFSGCGPIVRATILKDRKSKQPGGKALVQFGDVQSAAQATKLHASRLLDRPIAVEVLHEQKRIRSA